jgi:hypothetical protein
MFIYTGFELVKVALLIFRTLMCTNIHRYTSIYICMYTYERIYRYLYKYTYKLTCMFTFIYTGFELVKVALLIFRGIHGHMKISKGIYIYVYICIHI